MKLFNYLTLLFLFTVGWSGFLSANTPILEKNNVADEMCTFDVVVSNVTCDFAILRYDLLVNATNTNDNFFFLEVSSGLDGEITLTELAYGETHFIFEFAPDFVGKTITVFDEPNNPGCEEQVVIECPNSGACPVQAIADNESIEILGLTSADNTKLFDNDYNIVWECATYLTNCASNETIDLPVGTYFLSITTPTCNDFISVAVGNPSITDNDNDGVFADDDCDDNNASIPATPNSTCDDNNPNTINDLIQSDGCTCVGTACVSGIEISDISCSSGYLEYDILVTNQNIGIWGTFELTNSGTQFAAGFYGSTKGMRQYVGSSTGPYTFELFDLGQSSDGDPTCYVSYTVDCLTGVCDVSVTSVNGSTINISGMKSAESAQLVDANNVTVWECNTGDCISSQTLSGLAPGDYVLGIQSNVCDELIPLTVTGCVDAIDNDGDGVCAEDDCDDNNPNIPTTPFTSCDDGNPDTFGEIILAGGCICSGADRCSSTEVQTSDISCTGTTLTFTATVSAICCGAVTGWAIDDANGNEIGTGSWSAFPVPRQYTVDISNLSSPYTFIIYDRTATSTKCFVSFEADCSGGNGGCAVDATVDGNSINISGLTASENTKLFDSNIDAVWECNPWNNTPCSGNETITGLSTGSYFLSVQSDNCEEWIPITVEGGENGCIDLDNDGICANEDCDDNNPNLPAPIGSSCDDGNPSSDNDQIQADGCTCQGNCNSDVQISNVSCTGTSLTFTANVSINPRVTGWRLRDGNGNSLGTFGYDIPMQITVDVSNFSSPYTFTASDQDAGSSSCIETFEIECTPSSGGCNVTAIAGNGTLSITGLSSLENTKLFDSNIDLVWECNPWNGNTCSGNEDITGLSAGTYFLSVQSDACEEWIPITVEGGNGNITDTDGDGIPDTEDCAPTDATIPAPVGTPCDDLDTNTNNDVIQDDMCTCSGTQVGDCNVSVIEFASGLLTINGLTAENNVKLFDETASSAGLIWECNPWNGNPCGITNTVSGLQNGATYFLSVQKGGCNEWIPIVLDGNTALVGKNKETSNHFSITNLFPNPVTTEAFVKLKSSFNGEVSVEIYNVIGSLQNQTTINIEEGNNTFELDIANLKTGIFVMVIKDQNNQTKSTRFVKHN